MKPRYIYEDQHLSEEEARDMRADQQENIYNRIKALREEIAELQSESLALSLAPLPTTIRVQRTLMPGDEGYEQAPVRFNELDWTGDFTWKNVKV